jgi:hypothetical protein
MSDEVEPEKHDVK